MTKQLWTAKWLVTADEASLIEDTFADVALATDIVEQYDNKQELTIILSGPPALDRLAAIYSAPVVTQLPDQDWLALTARGDTQAGRFTIKPYEPGVTVDAQTILIDGNYAFGDGHHATTRGCIEAMERLHSDGLLPQHIADIGCGTGVLALAAARLWPYADLIASDLDAAAVAATQAAAVWNNVSLTVLTAAGFDGCDGESDLILMNLLAGIVIDLIPDTAVHLAEGGRVIVSGILEEQVAWVMAACSEHGLYEMARIAQDGWVTLTLSRDDPH